MSTSIMSSSLKGSDARSAVDPGSTAPIDRLNRSDLLKARYGVWIQTLVNHPIGIEKGVYLSTFQEGRGQHITALNTGQARALGNRLIALAEEVETKARRDPDAAGDLKSRPGLSRFVSSGGSQPRLHSSKPPQCPCQG